MTEELDEEGKVEQLKIDARIEIEEEQLSVRACHALPCVWAGLEPMVHGGFARLTPARTEVF